MFMPTTTLKPFAIIDDTGDSGSSTIATSAVITQITLLSAAGQTANGPVTSSAVYFGPSATGSSDGGTNAGGGTITFSNAGVYHQSTGGDWAPGGSTSGSSGITNGYFSATGSASPSTVTFTFEQTETYFGFLWGSMNAGNTVTFYRNGTAVYTCSASDIIGKTISGTTATSQDSYYAAFNISGGYDKVVFASTSGGLEFADVGYSTQTFNYTKSSTTKSSTTYGTGRESLSGSGTTTVAAYDSSTDNEFCFLAGTRFAAPRRSFPIRIAAGALDENVPVRDLLVSPAHALLVDGILAQAGALVNGLTITHEAAMAETFAYYHVELASHELLLAEGAPAESFLDVTAEMPFDNRATRPAFSPVAEMALPRAQAQSARQVPAAIHARLARRAGAKSAA
jgi:hypothetical protein